MERRWSWRLLNALSLQLLSFRFRDFGILRKRVFTVSAQLPFHRLYCSSFWGGVKPPCPKLSIWALLEPTYRSFFESSFCDLFGLATFCMTQIGDPRVSSLGKRTTELSEASPTPFWECIFWLPQLSRQVKPLVFQSVILMSSANRTGTLHSLQHGKCRMVQLNYIPSNTNVFWDYPKCRRGPLLRSPRRGGEIRVSSFINKMNFFKFSLQLIFYVSESS